jgi:2-keto-3-deoxy-L-rhamnonate aldolase RhmA
MNELKERIKRGEKLSGAIVSLTDPCLCEIFGNVGFDYIWIDMEHTYTSYKEVLCHLNAARSTGTPAIVRVPHNDLTATKKVLEMADTT